MRVQSLPPSNIETMSDEPTPRTDAENTRLADFDWSEGYGELLGFARELERENAKMARWIIQHCDHWSGDHACAECFPGGENIVEGFRCAVHVANSAPVGPNP